MLIVEGVDKSGKTTLIKRLLEIIPDSYRVHFGLLPDDWDYYEDYLYYMHENVILDRFIDSEIVYGDVYRGYIKLKKENEIKIRAKGLELGVILLYCNPGNEVIHERITSQNDEIVKNKQQIITLNQKFQNLYSEKYPWPIINVDTTKKLEKNIENEVINNINYIKQNQLLKLHGYRGVINAKAHTIFYSNKLIEEFCNKDYMIIKPYNINNHLVNLDQLSDIYDSIIVQKEIAHLYEQSITKQFQNTSYF